MKRSRAQLKKLHRELWQWLADNPGMEKEDWPGWDREGEAMNDCFACEAAGLYNKDPLLSDCRKCPVDWGYVNSKTKM